MDTDNFLKIVYFDENFVADFLQIIAGGEMKKTTELMKELDWTFDANANAEANVGKEPKSLPKLLSFLSGVSIKGGGQISADVSKRTNRIAKSIIENTLLADFVDMIKSDSRRTKNPKCAGIEVFRKVSVRPEKNSFTFIMLIAPYTNMLDGKVNIAGTDREPFTLDITKIGEAVEQGRGYYEFIADTEKKEVILRFNSTAFRNHYTLSDLPKMLLTYYAVKVGRTTRRSLQLEQEFQFGTQNSAKRLNYIDDNSANKDEELEVYDVVLAGVVDNE